MNVTLDDGRPVTCRRRGLKITLAVGDEKGEGLMRRIADDPDVIYILNRALSEAVASMGAGFLLQDGWICHELPE